jgi:hypothetical protein
VTLGGANFDASLVIVGVSGIAPSNVNVVNSTTVTATLAIASNAILGGGNLVVFTLGGGPSNAGTFTVTAPAMTVSKIGTGGTVTSSPAGINCGATCSLYLIPVRSSR